MADVKKSIVPKVRDNTDKNIVDLDSVGLGHLKRKLTDIDLSNYDSTDSSDVVLKDITSSSKDLNRLRKLVKKYNESPLSLVRKISADEIRLGKTINFNKGGTPMMKRQMELFEDGGLKEEGGMIEPESGNVVPSGSSREEVADDIPAMLSEGEFVFPADVTRYIGLDKLMSLRQDAKMGLAQMESMGQMGEERDASKDEELPFGMADLIVVSEAGEPLEMAEGGVASTRSLATSAVPTRSNRKTTYKEIMGQNRIIFKEYRNAAGESMTIAFLGNVPLYPIPDGYTYYDPSNPDSHPSTGVGGTAPPTQPNILVEEPREYSGELDDLGRPVGSVHTPPNYSTMDNVEFTSAMTTKHTKGLNTDKVALGLLSIFAPPIGAVATIAHYKDVQLDIARMEARKSQGNLTAEQTKALDAAITIAKGKIGSAFAKGVLTITDSIAKALGLNPQQIEQYKNNATQVANAAVNTETNNTETVESFVDRVQKEVTNTAQLKSNEQMITDQSFTSPTAQLKSNEQMITDQRFTPPTTEQLSGEDLDYITAKNIAKARELGIDVSKLTKEQLLDIGTNKPKTIEDLESQYSTSPSNVLSLPSINYNATPNYMTEQGKKDYENFVAARLGNQQMTTDQRFIPDTVSQTKMLGYPNSQIDTNKLDNQTFYEPGTNIANQMANMQMTTGYPGKDMGAATKAQFGTQVVGSPAQPKTDDYGNAFGKGMANNITSDFYGNKSLDSQIDMMNLGYGTPVDSPFSVGFGGGYQPASQPSTAPAATGIQDPSGLSAFNDMTGINDASFSTPVGPEIGIQDPSKVPAPIEKNQIIDAYSAYNPYGTTAATTTGVKSDDYGNVQDPSEIPTEKTTFDSIVGKDNQAEYDRLADASALSNREKALGDIDPREVNLSKAQQLSNQQMTTNQMMGLTPTPSAGKYSYAKDLDKDFNVVSTPVETPVVKKYDPSSLVSGAYTGSGFGGTISEGGKVAGVTSPEGVVPSGKNDGKVATVSKSSANGKGTTHTVFSNSKGELYAKNPFGSTFNVTKNNDGSYKAGGKTATDFVADAQPKSILSGLLSGDTKSTPTVTTPSKSFAAADKSKSDQRSAGASTSSKSKSKSVSAPKGRDEAEAVGDGADGPSKIVCTEMYRQTNLDDWAKAMKMWDVYQRKYLTPIHEVGYHWLFKPYVRGMKKSTILTSLGSSLAEKRTQHIKHILTKGKAKDNLIGKIWCSIIHPIVYTAGKVKLYTEKRY